MVFRVACFLALPFHSSNENVDAACWSGEYTEERCCDPTLSTGNPECWDGVYTYERCCQAKVPSNVNVTSGAGCWSGGFTEEQCCDPAYESGNPSCWDGVYTYQRCCHPKDPTDPIRSVGSRPGAPMKSIGFHESCWGGNLNAETWCCNKVRDPVCWQGGNDYQKCCKRDAAIIASLSGLQNSSLLPVVKKPSLEYPFPSAVARCGAGGHLDQTMCDLLQAAEHALRRPKFEECWDDGLTRQHCCSTVLEGPRDPHCFDGSRTYERCCVGVSPPVELLEAFYGCDHCVSFLKQSTFSCQEYRSCLGHRGTIIELAQGAHGSRDILCLPRVRQSTDDMLSSAAFTLEWVTTHHASSTQFDAQNNPKQHLLEIGCLLAPWFLGAGFWFRTKTSREDMAVKKADHTRNWSLDVARLIGIAAVVAIHLPFLFRERDPQANQHLSVWNYCQRFVDIFGVVSVLLTKHSESMVESWDALWRKLARQLPLSFLLVRHSAWTGGFCRSVNTTCAALEEAEWSTEFIARCLTFSYHWYLIVDIKLWLLLRGMYILNHHGMSLVIPAAMTIPISLACYYTGYLSREVEPQQYYQLWTYRLPMSLLVLFVSRSKRFQSWRQHTWLWSSAAVVFCGLGWVRCRPKFVEDLWQEPCTHDGLDFILGGVFFHLGVTMLCLLPCSLPESLRPAVSRASQLSLGLLTLHWHLLSLIRDCEDNASPWLLVKTRMLHFHIASLDPSPRVVILLWATLLIAVPLLAQLVFWTVQRPWEMLLMRFPKPISRSFTMAYLLYFAWCWRG